MNPGGLVEGDGERLSPIPFYKGEFIIDPRRDGKSWKVVDPNKTPIPSEETPMSAMHIVEIDERMIHRDQREAASYEIRVAWRGD